MADIKKSLTYVLQNEGGASYTDHPHDKGGPTKWGITLKELTIWRHHPCTSNDVRQLEEDEACQIYKINYWDALKLDTINDQNIATALFDVAVNRGVGCARQYAAYVCQALQKPTVNDCEHREFIKTLAIRCRDGYLHIIASHPDQVVFKNGWLNRASRLLTLI